MKANCRGSFIKLVWFRALKNRLVLVDEVQIQRYVKCYIMLLFGTVMFGYKSAAGVHWKFLPLLRNYGGSYSSVGNRPAWHTCIDRCVEQLVSTVRRLMVR
ncbi:hypothetical protein Ahy_Scaffold1g106966 isoform G [Arachis hypogaea]|nr:hypothetical protein Ahy_Scaffold1g106966 isoform G [Arachis hypogaea]